MLLALLLGSCGGRCSALYWLSNVKGVGCCGGCCSAQLNVGIVPILRWSYAWGLNTALQTPNKNSLNLF